MTELPLTLEALRAAVARGETFTFRPFYGHTPRSDGRLSDAVFSQWWRGRFVADGVTYTSAEQYMMAAKARLFGDDETLAKILAAEEPADVKALGREVRGYVDATWAAKRLEAVTAGNVAKFSATLELRAYLLATGDEVLVEAAQNDLVWGIGYGRESPLVREPARWRGQNLLGFALMRARVFLRSALSPTLSPRGEREGG